MLKNWTSPKWKTYWAWIFVRRLARITTGFEQILYNFYGKFERGQKVLLRNKPVETALYMSLPFNTFLLTRYVEQYEDPRVMKFVEILCNDLKQAFHKILSNNTWMEPSTRKYALEKLKAFKFIYGRHKNILPDPDLDYTTSLYENMTRVMSWRNKQFVSLEGKPEISMPIMDWTQYPVKMTGHQPYIVNASYTPTENAIFMNLGYLQKPFVDLDNKGLEYNLAQIGYTLGHEMSHGFDDMGSQYGADGNMKDWWTSKDKAKFKAIQQNIIKQYNEFAKRDGIDYDASISIGEDLADISGMNICEHYLRDYHLINKDTSNDMRILSYKEFYTHFAIQQRQKVSKRAVSAQLKTNPHPPDKYRCNIPLSRSEVFKQIYDVKRGDGMWWSNSNQVW